MLINQKQYLIHQKQYLIHSFMLYISASHVEIDAVC